MYNNITFWIENGMKNKKINSQRLVKRKKTDEVDKIEWLSIPPTLENSIYNK